MMLAKDLTPVVVFSMNGENVVAVYDAREESHTRRGPCDGRKKLPEP